MQREHPDVIFLSEAFTRPKVMRALAKAGFTQSYTYFTWRNFKAELTEYLTELTQSEMKEYYRGNLFPNTHDILPLILQEGGRPAFKMRLALAATLSSVYGIYSGYELCENTPAPRRGVPQLREVRVPGPGLGRAGEHHPLHHAHQRHPPRAPRAAALRRSTFYRADAAAVLFYGKMTPDRRDAVFVAVNLDPKGPHETVLHLPLDALRIGADQPYRVRDLLRAKERPGRGPIQRILLDPEDEPAFVFEVRPA